MVEQWSRKLAEAGLHEETGSYQGDPKHELLTAAEAWEADAIFLRTRAWNMADASRLARWPAASRRAPIAP